ncbi:hypothetical protein EON65_19625 [archaeon]|nr:MAG: hypothetical protein EON65_19625 [archaeon]
MLSSQKGDPTKLSGTFFGASFQMWRVIACFMINNSYKRKLQLIILDNYLVLTALVICTICCYSVEYAQSLMQAGIPVRMVADSSVGFYMESINMCVVGAEGVMENGGIINKIGTFQIALVAHALQKPFYVAVESYKFARMYPLSQRDMMSMIHSEPKEILLTGECTHIDEIAVESPNVDFTPGTLITLLFTDIGVLTPAAVSDELIRLYQ